MDKEPSTGYQSEAQSTSTPTSSVTRMSMPPPPPPSSAAAGNNQMDLSSIRGSDVSSSLLTDESAEGIPLNDALIHSTMGSILDESFPNIGPGVKGSDSLTSFAEKEKLVAAEAAEETPMKGVSAKPDMDITGPPVPPESDDDEEWLASSKKQPPPQPKSEAPTDVSRVQGFDDFGHPNVESGGRRTGDLFGVTKSSDEDDYELIPAQQDTSQSEDGGGNTTVLEKSSSSLLRGSEEGVLRSESWKDSSPCQQQDNTLNSMSSTRLQSVQERLSTSDDEGMKEEEEEEQAARVTAPSAVPSATGGGNDYSSSSRQQGAAAQPSSSGVTNQQQQHQAFESSPLSSSFSSASRDVSLQQQQTRLSESEPESKKQPGSPKRTSKQEQQVKDISSSYKYTAPAMASQEPTSTTGCPFTAVREIVSWKDPRKSGVVFGIGLTILTSLLCCSVISVVAYTALLSLASTLAFRIYKGVMQAVQKTNEGHPFKEYLEIEVTPPPEKVHQFVDVALKHVNAVLLKLRSVFLVEDIVDSIKFFVIFWCLTYIGSWFNGLTLVILSYLVLFSVPKVYEMHKAQIDQALEMACRQITDVINMVKSKIPFPAQKDKTQ